MASPPDLNFLVSWDHMDLHPPTLAPAMLLYPMAPPAPPSAPPAGPSSSRGKKRARKSIISEEPPFLPHKLKAFPVQRASNPSSDDSDFKPAEELQLPGLSLSGSMKGKEVLHATGALNISNSLQDNAPQDTPAERLGLPPSPREQHEDNEPLDYNYICRILEEDPPTSDEHESSP